jgi:undecaprenyl pyrophosphate phosphatase UppP
MPVTMSGATISGGVTLGYYTTYATASALLAANPSLAGRDGYYFLYPSGLAGGEQMV